MKREDEQEEDNFNGDEEGDLKKDNDDNDGEEELAKKKEDDDEEDKMRNEKQQQKKDKQQQKKKKKKKQNGSRHRSETTYYQKFYMKRACYPSYFDDVLHFILGSEKPWKKAIDSTVDIPDRLEKGGDGGGGKKKNKNKLPSGNRFWLYWLGIANQTYQLNIDTYIPSQANELRPVKYSVRNLNELVNASTILPPPRHPHYYSS